MEDAKRSWLHGPAVSFCRGRTEHSRYGPAAHLSSGRCPFESEVGQHPAPKSTKHHGRAQVVSGGSARETQVLFFIEAGAREWATTGKKAAVVGGPAPVQLHKPAAEALLGTRPTSTGVLPPVPEPPASGDRLADGRPLVRARPPRPVSSRATPRRRLRRPLPRLWSTTTRRWAPRGRRTPPARHHPGCAALRPRQRPDPPRLGRQARRRTPLPHRRPQEVGPQPALRRHRHHRPRLTTDGRAGFPTRHPQLRTCPLSPTRSPGPGEQPDRQAHTEQEHPTMKKTALPAMLSFCAPGLREQIEARPE